MGKKTLFKVLILGSECVGKSTLAIQHSSNIFTEKHDENIEEVYRKIGEINEFKYILEINDLNITNNINKIEKELINEYHGFVLVYSITSQISFNKLKEYYQFINKYNDCDYKSILLIGNKNDLAVQSERQVTHSQAEELAENFDCNFNEITCKNIKSINESFDLLINDLILKKKLIEKPIKLIKRNSMFNLNGNNKDSENHSISNNSNKDKRKSLAITSSNNNNTSPTPTTKTVTIAADNGGEKNEKIEKNEKNEKNVKIEKEEKEEEKENNNNNKVLKNNQSTSKNKKIKNIFNLIKNKIKSK